MRKILLVIFFGLTVTKSIAQNDRQIFNFESDIRIFTVYAFFNASGFNHDWLEMHPLRVEIRAYLDSVLKDDYKLKIKAYNNRVGLNWAECGIYALHLEMAPPFNWI